MKKLMSSSSSCGSTRRSLMDRLCLFPATYASSCLCIPTNNKINNDEENKPLIQSDSSISHVKMLKDVIAPPPTLAFQLKPKMVVMKVSMHCNGCARQVKKHISKLEGVSSYEIDMETKMVVVTGDIVPFEVLESVSKVKNAQLWNNDIH